LSKDLFPLKVNEAVTGYLLGLVEISGAGADLQKIMDGSIVKYLKPEVKKGSNAIAINTNLTTDGQTYLAINSHQPLEGWYSWYEAHLISDEGQNILGGTFPGGSTIFHGVNKNLGWAHTVNSADFSDVFKLKMHPKKNLHYELDGEWKELEKENIWAWLKVFGPISIPIRRTIYHSDLGTTFETEHGFFAWQFQAKEAIKSVEQWYRMNRANNFEEFKDALRLRGIPCTNLVYADKEHNIYYLSNGNFPGRNGGISWKEVIPGHTSNALYSSYEVPFDSLPQVLNPDCGFVFNTNNTPYSSSCYNENPFPNSLQLYTSFMDQKGENNRSHRFLELINEYAELDYEDFKTIKYNQQYPSNLISPKVNNLEDLLTLNSAEHPDIVDAVELLNNWDRKTNIENEEALFFIHCYKNIWAKVKGMEPLHYGNQLDQQDFIETITEVKKLMLDKYGKLRVPLGDVQRHIRGQVDLPISGGPDVLAAIHTKELENGLLKANAGESYISLVRFQDEGLPIIETIHAYGSSADPESPHYTDQMQLFVDQKLKPMTLDRAQVLADAKSIYHPMEIIQN